METSGADGSRGADGSEWDEVALSCALELSPDGFGDEELEDEDAAPGSQEAKAAAGALVELFDDELLDG